MVEEPTSRRSAGLWLLGLVLVRIVLLGWYSAHLPLLEKFDEANHYEVARFIAHEGRLPRASDAPPLAVDDLRIFQQYDQPPLTYLLLAPLVRVFDGSGPYAVQPAGASFCNAEPSTYYIHPQTPSPHLETNWHGVRASRLAIMSLTTLALPLIWWAACLLTPASQRLALLASATYALLPPVLDLSIWVNNDALLLLIGAALLVPLARSLKRRETWHNALGLVVLSAAAVLTKLSGLPALVWSGALLLTQQRWRRLFFALLPLTLCLIIALNLAQCGLPFCRLHRLSLPVTSVEGLIASTRYFLRGLGEFAQHFVAPSPRILEDVPPLLRGLSPLLYGAALLGALAASTGRDPTVRAALLWTALLLVGCVGLALARIWWVQSSFFRPRYISLALPALCLLLALGIRWWMQRLGAWFGGLWLLGLAALALVTPWLTYRPIWQSVQRVENLPATAMQIEPLRFANGLRVDAYTRGDDALWLAMRPEHPISEATFAVLTLYDAEDQRLRACGQLAGTGLWSAPDWQADEWVVQRFDVVLRDATAFSLALYPLQDWPPPLTYYDSSQPVPLIAGGSVSLAER